MSHLNVGEAEPVAGATIYNDDYTDCDDGTVIPRHCVFHNYHSVHAMVKPYVDRSYERPFRWFYLTFKPYNKNYERDIDFYLRKGFDYARKKIGKVKFFTMTREINAKKVHLNVLCCTDRPLEKLHNQKTNKYFIHCQECPRMLDRQLVLDYILKEARTRYFHKYIDYQYK